MRQEMIKELQFLGFRVYVERGRVTITHRNDGLTLHYFPELGSWYGMEDDRLLQAPAMSNGTPGYYEDKEVNLGEVTAFNEANAIDTAIVRHYFGPLPRSCYDGR